MQLVFGRSLIRSILDNNFDMNYGKQHLLLAKKSHACTPTYSSFQALISANAKLFVICNCVRE